MKNKPTESFFNGWSKVIKEMKITPVNKDLNLVEKLKEECKRVKIQRNEYEQQLTFANREIVRLKSELTLLENYINRKTTKQ